MVDRILKYCPRCGKHYLVKIGELMVCDVCKKAVMVEFGDPFCFDTVDLDIFRSESTKSAIEALVKASPEFDQEAWDYRVRVENGEEPNPCSIPEPVHKPKCPTCGSTMVRQISGIERAGSILAWGLFSGKINKSFECLNCRYKW